MPEGLLPGSIQSINVLKGDHATPYGEDGKDGVIFIYTKGYMSAKATKDGSAAPVQYVGKVNTVNGAPVSVAKDGAKTLSDVKVVGYGGTASNVKTENTNANTNTDAANKKVENK